MGTREQVTTRKGSSSRDFGQVIAQLSGRIAKENIMQGCRNRIFRY